MKPLLSIKSVPITIDVKTTRAQLKQTGHQPRYDMNREKGKLDIQTNPARINIDSKEMRASMGLKTPSRVIRETADTARQDAREATVKYVEDGNYMQESTKTGGSSTPVADLAMSKSIRNYERVMTFMPNEKPEMSMEGGTIAFNYIADKLNFDWDISTRPYLEYVPHSVEFNVTQYPEVIIEYVGDPIYVPPSANPNYTPPPDAD